MSTVIHQGLDALWRVHVILPNATTVVHSAWVDRNRAISVARMLQDFGWSEDKTPEDRLELLYRTNYN